MSVQNFYVSQDKRDDPEGQSRIRAARSKDGDARHDGIKAYFDMYSWYLGRSGQELQSRAEFVMHPPVPKTEGEIAAIIDKWRDQYNFARRIGCYQAPSFAQLCAHL